MFEIHSILLMASMLTFTILLWNNYRYQLLFHQMKLEYDHYAASLNLSCQRLLRMHGRNYRFPHVLLPRIKGWKRLKLSVAFRAYLRHCNILMVRVAQS